MRHSLAHAMPRVAAETYEEETRRMTRQVHARARYLALPAKERVKRSRLNELLRRSRRLLLSPEQDAARKKKMRSVGEHNAPVPRIVHPSNETNTSGPC